MDPRAALIADIDAFLAERRMPDTRFGLAALNDGKFMRRLRSGGNITFETAARVQAFMRREREASPAAEHCDTSPEKSIHKMNNLEAQSGTGRAPADAA